jgi:hypothetical protein
MYRLCERDGLGCDGSRSRQKPENLVRKKIESPSVSGSLMRVFAVVLPVLPWELACVRVCTDIAV